MYNLYTAVADLVEGHLVGAPLTGRGGWKREEVYGVNTRGGQEEGEGLWGKE